MENSAEIAIGKPPGGARLPIYLLLTSALLLAILIAGAAFWEHLARQGAEELAYQYHQPAVRLLLRMEEEAQRLNERLLDDAWSGRALNWDKAFRARHYDHLAIIRKNLDHLLSLENRYGARAAPLEDKERQLRSVEGRLLALEEEWAAASIVTSLVFHEFATRELPLLAKELIRLRIVQEDAANTLLDRLEIEQVFELQILFFSVATLLLLTWWGTRRGLRQIRQTQAYQSRLAKALEQSREESALLGRTARCFLWEMDPTGTRFVRVDGGLMAWLGRHSEGWVDLEEWAAAIHPEDREQAVRMRGAILAGETEETTFEYRVFKSGGEVVWLRDVQVLRPGEGGGRYRGVFVDRSPEVELQLRLEAEHVDERARQEAEINRLSATTTRLEEALTGQDQERVRLEEELATVQDQRQEIEARLSAILHEAHVAITLKDLQGRYVLVNRRFAELFEVAADTLPGQTDAQLFPESVAMEMGQRERMVIEDGQAQLSDEVLPMGEDARGLFSVLRFPMRAASGEVTGVFAVLVDVTDRKILEEELLGEVRLAKTQARNAGRAQTRLLAAMGHEVPSLVRGMVRMIQRLQESGPPLRQQGRLELLAQSAASLLAVVEALREGINRKSDALPGENFDLLAMLEETAAIFSRYAHGAGKRLHGRIAQGVPRGVHGDAERLRRLLAILLGGAIHAVARGEVLFSVQSHPQDLYRLLFQVPAGQADQEREDDLAVLERLAVDLGGGCRLGQASGEPLEGPMGTGGLISVIVQLSAPVGQEQESEPGYDEPVNESV